ncbi:MAG: hypothetical protein B7Y07_07655 [Halothiobacillus sp. 24-54-40]|jgi:hypothetical protein|nr:MAG: hypothetical protein B7Y58_03030 [Halothiobacillus sp. 35-54-62]OYY54386.1 MAG: hypothetical protein B7Y53_06255 [Halothiobacillus sp. 28-55-5]OYZ86527.1 MAG: hypothetical protein B7Y07_07655 [Halothiobacillus sp. 24-54-40]OZA80886.1 MAG: hypothetical protein B7X64_04130 [Halothiobacillus sp. 39-53-45]HQS03768.1 hypothetical protein [Halothiobacillus sp.]
MSQALTQSEFNQQVAELISRHGAGAFAATAGNYPPYTLFVEDDTVIAEPASSPKHRYGAFCVLPLPFDEARLAEHITKWLNRGEAYTLYLSMNVCRYDG